MKILALAVLFVVVASASIAPLLHLENPNVIDGSYIIVLKDGLQVAHRDAHIADLESRINVTNAKESEVGFKYNIGNLIGFSARLSKELLEEQLAHSNVKYIEADQVMSINYKPEPRAPAALTTQTGATWGISRVSHNTKAVQNQYVYNAQYAGLGVTVFVIDTGILVTHNEFATGRATAAYNAITGESNTDLNGHGTHCAGTIGGKTYGVAKDVTLKAVKVLSASGSGSNAGVIAGVDYVANQKISRSVASMSLGGGVSTTLDAAVASAVKAGVSFAVAAGNDNANACNTSPAREPTAVTVGATTNTDARSSFSNYGTCLSIFAPGSSITSAWIGSNTATNTISGTSMATPHVAGGLALAWSYNSALTSTTLKTTLIANSITGIVTSPGTGSPSNFLFTKPQ